uniref:1-aminocyclopropane-1-carboxylate synthase homolog (Arabidopsis)(non-functional) n=1 Tax=Amphilophus citrinellus TaxID=61819 RepID=A0A3Q0QPK6_AMPCI
MHLKSIVRHERGSNWTDPEIVELLQLWSDESVQIELESSLRNQRVFDRIAHILREKGIYRTGDQCREKIKKMKLEYRRIKDNHKMRSWKFYDVMDRVLANRPAITYSSLGGAVIAQQVFQSPGAPEAYLQGVPESMLNSGEAPPEMYYGSGDDQETDGQSLLEPEDTLGRAESTTNTRISPSGCHSVMVIIIPRKEGSHRQTSARQRKRRRGGKTSWCHRGGRCGGQERLDKALASFLSWQQSAEERLLSLEEARLERELQAEERREQREERRAEQERQHELRLLSMLTGVLLAVREGTQTTTPTDPAVSPLAHLSASLMTTPNALATLRGDEGPGNSSYLSNRGNSIRLHEGILQEGYIQYGMDRHHDTENPEGIINMGTSENKLCYDLLHKRLIKPDMLHINPSLLQYSDWRGHAFLREEVAKFLTRHCCSPNPLKADNVVVMNGCGSLFSCVAAVICDPKDAILIPTPFYGVITEDLHLYSDVKLFHVPLDYSFFFSVLSLKTVKIQCSSSYLLPVEPARFFKGLTIRGVILMNPHNPLAEIYSLKEMITFLEFAKRNALHAIVDEVYMLTVFDESVTFQSVLSADSLPDPQRTHVMWGMSKDFAMAGIRIGTLYTENRDLVEALAKLGSFHGISGTTQHQVAQLLQDKEWISEEFLPENRCRLKAAHSYLTGELLSMGIPYLDRPATLYVWADLRKYLRESSFEEELSLWRCFLRHKVLLSCGQAFSCCVPGWFRIVFADQQHHLHLGQYQQHRQSLLVRLFFPTQQFSSSAKLDSADSDTAAIVNSTSLTQSNSSDELKERDSPVPDIGSPVTEDCQASKPAESLDSLIGTLRHQIRSSDWLEKSTPELSAGEDPEIFDVFKVLLQRARK